ncbi:hypothetical protein AMECASPLE_029566 [Ameca splendens]|uniref:Uncharacterized protein n=1 Tax=Ameca splendens TaxID=208324 RepID=A0ABV0YTC0_9TELE
MKGALKIGTQMALTSSPFNTPVAEALLLDQHLPNATEPHHLLIYLLLIRTFKSLLCDTVWAPVVTLNIRNEHVQEKLGPLIGDSCKISVLIRDRKNKAKRIRDRHKQSTKVINCQV